MRHFRTVSRELAGPPVVRWLRLTWDQATVGWTMSGVGPPSEVRKCVLLY